MPKYDLVYYETNKITKTIEAATLEEAIAEAEGERGRDPEFWADCEEETLGTNGVEQAYDAETGELLYDSDEDDGEEADSNG